MSPKKIGRSIVCSVLEYQAKRLIKKNDFKIIAVIGSVGKTSTKLAISKLLETKQKVIYQDGNYNDRVTVPLVLFNRTEPNILNIWSWLKIFIANEYFLRKTYPYDIAVLELGPDGPNQLKHFSYLKPYLTVLTAIAAEHMEYFKSLDNVALEELVPLSYSKNILINTDDVPAQYLPKSAYKSYGINKTADSRLIGIIQRGLDKQALKFQLPGKNVFSCEIKLVGNSGAKIALAAAAVAGLLGWSETDIKTGLVTLTAVAGRMQILRGIKDSIIIDDTYNASPIAVKAALDVLYSQEAPQRIAILGSMNELGTLSKAEHKDIGAYCDPKKIDMLITIGSEAEKYLVPTATKNGVKVRSFMNPNQAGQYVRSVLKNNAVILAKGSQNGVFAEEAVKQLLLDKADMAKLVRQSLSWLDIKNKQFRA